MSVLTKAVSTGTESSEAQESTGRISAIDRFEPTDSCGGMALFKTPMKLTDEQKRRLTDERPNPETLHFTYDEMMKKRLRELDPEFVEELDSAVEGVDFGFM